MKKWIFIFAAILLPLNANTEAFTVYGAGSDDSCGTWISDRKTERRWYQAGQWFQGYLAGAVDHSDIKLKKTNSDAMLVWLDNYCQENPLTDFFDAVRELLYALEIE